MPARRPGKSAGRATLSQPRRARETSPPPAPSSIDDSLLATLTPRESEVLTLWLDGFNDKKVARCLGTKVQTVRNQLASIEHKLGARSREELVALTHSLNDQ